MKIAEVSIGRPVFAAALNLVLLLFGAVTYSGIGVDLFPQVDLPVVTVTAIYPGADPAAVETKVADKLEEELNTLSGVDLLRSNHGPVVMEVNSSPGLEGIEEATGKDIAGMVIQFIEKEAKKGKTRTRGKG